MGNVLLYIKWSELQMLSVVIHKEIGEEKEQGGGFGW